ncbi:MAG: ABC transporter permease [Acidimicrobiales bacterium]
MTDLIAAEWLKLRTTRLLVGVLPAALAISFAAVAAAVLATKAPVLESTEGIRRVFSVTGAGAIVVLVVGILIAAGEYRHGTASDTFLTTPRRHRVVTAKLVVAAGVGLAAGALIAAASVGIASALYRTQGATFPFGDAEVWLTLAGTLAYTTLFAVLGVTIGALVRNQVLAVGGALVWIAIVEHTLVNLVPTIGRWLPVGAGQAIVRTPLDGLLSPLGGAAVLAAYVAAIAAVGIRAEATRDA